MALPSKALREGERVRLAGQDIWKISAVAGNVTVIDTVFKSGEPRNRSTDLAKGESHEVAEHGDIFVVGGIDGGGRYGAEAGPQSQEDRERGQTGRQENDRVGPTAKYPTDREADLQSPSRRAQLAPEERTGDAPNHASRVVAKDAEHHKVNRRENDVTASGDTVSDVNAETSDGAVAETPEDPRGSGPYKSRTKAQLEATAKDKGLTGYSKLTKDELIKELQK